MLFLSLRETENENAESSINIRPNGIPNTAASAKCGINIRSISRTLFNWPRLEFSLYIVVIRANATEKPDCSYSKNDHRFDARDQYDFVRIFVSHAC